MAKSLNESLFLLEILIDKIVYCKAPCCPEKDFKTTVTFEFLCVDPIEITDTSTGSCSAKCGGPFIKIFNTGKSCLFSLKEADIKKAMCNFSIKVTITKSLMCSCLPAKMNMGSCAIDMTKEFVQARKKYLENPVSGCHQSLRDNFRLVACDGSKTGDILLFLRISCFGKHIVTKFDASQTQGTLKTADQPSSTDRIERLCPAGKTCQSAKDPCACGAEAPPGACGVPHRRRLEAADGWSRDRKLLYVRRGTGNKPGSKLIDYLCIHLGGDVGECLKDFIAICRIARDCDDQFPKPEYQAPLECRNTDPYCLHVPKDCCPTGKKIVFQMPKDSCALNHKQRLHFNYATDGLGDLVREDPLQSTPLTGNSCRGPVYDFSNNIIKMRVAKTVELLGRKTNLEYNFITPVPVYDTTVPTRDTRTAQCMSLSSPRCCSPC